MTNKQSSITPKELKILLAKIESETRFIKRIRLLKGRKSQGSGRVVVSIDKDWVLKVAKNEKGIAQNLCESETWINATRTQRQYLARIKRFDKEGKWVIQRRVIKMNRNLSEEHYDNFYYKDSFRTLIKSNNLYDGCCEIAYQLGRINKKKVVVYDYGLDKNTWDNLY